MSLKINNLLLSSMETQTQEIVNSVNIKKNVLIPNSIPITFTQGEGRFISWEISPNLLTSIILLSNFKNIISGTPSFYGFVIHTELISTEHIVVFYEKTFSNIVLESVNDTQILDYYEDTYEYQPSIVNSKYYFTIIVNTDFNYECSAPTLTFFNY